MSALSWRRFFGSRFQFWFGLALGSACIYLAARGLDFPSIGRVLGAVNWLYVFLAWLVYVATQLTKGVRWRWLLSPRHVWLGLVPLTNILVIGQAINLLLPSRLGDLARAYLLGEETGSSKSYALGTVAAEKLLDLAALAVLTLAVVPLVAVPSWLAEREIPVLVMALGLAVAMGVLLAWRQTWVALANRLLARLPGSQGGRWHARLVAALDGLAALVDPGAAVAIWWWTIVSWLLAALTNWLLFLAFGLPLGMLPAVFLLVALQAGVSVPSMPGKIGVFHYLCVLALSVFGIPAAASLGYSLVLHLLVVGTSSAWAAFALWQQSWSVRQLAALETEAKIPGSV